MKQRPVQRQSEDALQEDLARFGLVDGRVKPPAAEDSEHDTANDTEQPRASGNTGEDDDRDSE